MTFPKVTDTCILATMAKATQSSPDKFAADTMMGLLDEQPEMMAAITALLHKMSGADEIGTPEMEAVLMATFCVLGISLKAIGAQMEANELNEAWGE